MKSIADAITRQDTKWLSMLPGIGATTAEQIVTTLKRKVTKYAMMNAPAEPPPAPAESAETNGKKKAGGKKQTPTEEQPAAPPSVVTEANGQLIEDVYLGLMGLGFNPMEARTRLDGLLTCGKPFATVQDAFSLIFAQKG